MTYYFLQSAAMFLVAYIVGCFCGCVLKTLVATAPDAYADDTDARPATAAVAVPRMTTPTPVAPQPRQPDRAPVVPAAARPAQPQARAPQPGSGVSAEVTAAAAAAAAATLATAVSRPAAAASVAARPATPATAPVITGDDLKRIKGIGPEIERKLNAIGVRRYSEMAAWSSSDVLRINHEIGQDGRVQHENWIEQAQILSRGGETAFSRRVDRREVNTGMVDTWTPTAPNEVARAAAAGAVSPPPAAPVVPPSAVVTAPPAASQPVLRPTLAQAPVMTMGASAAAAAAAAAATVAASKPVQAAPIATPPAAPAPAAATIQPAAAPAPGQPISMRPAPSVGNQRRFVRLAAPEGKPDDLSLIGGVGDKFAADLNKYGVYHYWQLAAMGPDDIDYMESRLGHKGRMRREEWPEQARELMAGKPPRARTDRERATHGAHEHGPGVAQAHPHAHSHAHPKTEAGAGQPQPGTPQAQGQPHPHTHTAHAHTAHTHVSTPVAPVTPAGAVSAPPVQPVAQSPAAPQTTVHHAAHTHTQGTAHHHVLGATLTAGAAAATAGAAIASASPANPVVPPPNPPASAPVRSSQPSVPDTMPVDSSASGWTPRSRPGNIAARTRDDLKRIKGIGVVIEKKLEAMGITSYAQIAAWGTPDIDKVSNALDFKGRIERENWVEQARILDGGGQTDFSRRMDRGDVTDTKV